MRGRNCIGLFFLWLCARILIAQSGEDKDVLRSCFFPAVFAIFVVINSVSICTIRLWETLRSGYSALRCTDFKRVLHFGLASRMVASKYLLASFLLCTFFCLFIVAGALIGVCIPYFWSTIFLWQQRSFDATLGFPGEGPCSLCGDSGHNFRTCLHRGDMERNIAASAASDPAVLSGFVGGGALVTGANWQASVGEVSVTTHSAASIRIHTPPPTSSESSSSRRRVWRSPRSSNLPADPTPPNDIPPPPPQVGLPFS